MKKIIYTLLATALLFSSCSNFLDTLDSTSSNQGNNTEQNNSNNSGNSDSTPEVPYNPSGNGDFYISFNLNGHGKENFKSFTGIPLGTEILFDKLPTPKNEENWIFDGWYDDTNTKITENFILRRNYNLTARWRSLITDKPIYLPETTSGTDGLNSRYVLFGDWPQTIKAKDVTIDESTTIKFNGFDCYKGSDNCYYVKKAAKFHENNYKHFSNNDVKQEGVEYYFKMEPIKWRVMNNYYQGKKQYLLFSEKYLTSTAEDYVRSEILFKNSNVQNTLDNMVQKAFSPYSQSLLIPNTNFFSKKVFLLTKEEFDNDKYFIKKYDNINIFREFTDYMIADDIYLSSAIIADTPNSHTIFDHCRFYIVDNNYVSYVNMSSQTTVAKITSKDKFAVVPAIIVQEIFE